jgi:hypothetical protein
MAGFPIARLDMSYADVPASMGGRRDDCERDFNSGWDNSCAEYTQGVAAHDLAHIGLGVAKTTISRRMRTRGRCPHSFAKKPFLLDGF